MGNTKRLLSQPRFCPGRRKRRWSTRYSLRLDYVHRRRLHRRDGPTNTGSSFAGPRRFRTARVYPYATGGTFQVADLNGGHYRNSYTMPQQAASISSMSCRLSSIPQLARPPPLTLWAAPPPALADRTRWSTGRRGSTPTRYLPYAVQTPLNLTSYDGNGNTIPTTWIFSSGYYSYLSREFRGFGYSRQYLPDSAISTSFLQDDVGKGLLTDKTLYSPDLSKVYKEWQYSYYDIPGSSSVRSILHEHHISLPRTKLMKFIMTQNANTPQKIGTAILMTLPTEGATWGGSQGPGRETLICLLPGRRSARSIG